MELCVIGAGAVGSTLAYTASMAGCRVELYSRRGGVRIIHGPLGSLSLEALAPPWHPSSCDYALLAVKSYDTTRALDMMEAFRVQSPLLVVAQNGLGGLEEALSRGRRAAAAVVNFGAFRRGAVIEVRGLGDVVMGCSRLDCRQELTGLAKCLENGGIEARVVADVEPYRWLKLAVNASINTVATLLGMPNSAILDEPHATRAALILASEVSRIASRHGVRLPLDAGEEVLRVAARTRSNINSTLQDILSGSRTEADSILGVLAGESRVIELAYALIKALEGLEASTSTRS